MKITHLIYAFPTGGSETMLVDIANEQINKAEVSLVIINAIYNKVLLSTLDKRISVRFINRKKRSRNIIPIIRLNILLLKMKSDVLHCHDQTIIPLLLPSLKKKAVLTVHDVNINSKYFKRFKKLFAISKVVKEDIYIRCSLYSTLVYNGICLNRFMIKERNTRSEILNVVIVSRLHHEKKGQHLALEALKFLKERGITNIHLDFIGSGSSEQYLKNLTFEFELNDQVNFLGLKDRDYIYTHLKDYDLLIQPSLYEGFGLSVVESMAAKVPVLVSDIDGPMEIIENGKFGFHFQSGNSEIMAEQIYYIILNYSGEQLRQKVEEAYLHVRANFEISTTAQLYIRYY